MPGPTQATPEMVDNLGKLDEFEMTKEGVRPLSAQNQADPSAQASPDGAGQEPAASPPETPPSQTAQTPTAPAGEPTAPATQAVEPTPPPVVEVIPGSAPAATTPPATAPVPVAPAPATKEPEGQTSALGKLEDFLTQQAEKATEEARRAVQSLHDKQTAQVTRQLEESKTRADKLTEDIRSLQTRDLTDAERAKVQETWAQQDERVELDAYKVTLLAEHKAVTVDSLLLEYKPYGVAREALEAIETPEEMELYCEQQKSGSLEKQLAERPNVAPVSPPPAVPTEPAAAPAPAVATTPSATAQPPQPNAPGVPAGATAPSDIGSQGAPAEGKKFSEEQGAGALKENLSNMDWDTVRVRQGG